VLIGVLLRSISNYDPDCHALFLNMNGVQSWLYQKRFRPNYSYSFRRLREE
jgi:hypothetical protein